MKFDFCVGNPPYQDDSNEKTTQAKPIYPSFVNESIKIVQKSASFITPSRWFAGGLGLDEYRNEMLNSTHISLICDFTNSKDCFPENSISGGVNIFVWKKDETSTCKFTNKTGTKESFMVRKLNEFPVFVRYNEAVSIIHMVKQKSTQFLDEITSPLMPFGLKSNFRGDKEYKAGFLKLFSSDGVTYVDSKEVQKGNDLIPVYKIMLSKTSAEHAGEPRKDGLFNVFTSSMRIANPNEICTHSYFVVGAWKAKSEAENCMKYLKTRFTRILTLMCINGFNLSKKSFIFIPLQDFTDNSDIDWSQSIPDIDKQLYAKYGLSQEEIDFIETHIKAME